MPPHSPGWALVSWQGFAFCDAAADTRCNPAIADSWGDCTAVETCGAPSRGAPLGAGPLTAANIGARGYRGSTRLPAYQLLSHIKVPITSELAVQHSKAHPRGKP